jgi:hypothetical protein
MHERDPMTDPRKAFNQDIAADILASIDAGHKILLLGDFNEALASDDAGMLKLATTCGLLDLMSIRHSFTPDPRKAFKRDIAADILARQKSISSNSENQRGPLP